MLKFNIPQPNFQSTFPDNLPKNLAHETTFSKGYGLCLNCSLSSTLQGFHARSNRLWPLDAHDLMLHRVHQALHRNMHKTSPKIEGLDGVICSLLLFLVCIQFLQSDDLGCHLDQSKSSEQLSHSSFWRFMMDTNFDA
jgi:hypothetical protein